MLLLMAPWALAAEPEIGLERADALTFLDWKTDETAVEKRCRHAHRLSQLSLEIGRAEHRAGAMHDVVDRMLRVSTADLVSNIAAGFGGKLSPQEQAEAIGQVRQVEGRLIATANALDTRAEGAANTADSLAARYATHHLKGQERDVARLLCANEMLLTRLAMNNAYLVILQSSTDLEVIGAGLLRLSMTRRAVPRASNPMPEPDPAAVVAAPSAPAAERPAAHPHIGPVP